MKRTNNFAFLHGIIKADGFTTKNDNLFVQVPDDSELNRLLKIIFSKDENGVISGDIAVMMNSKASPEVIQFIKEVLQQDMSNYRTPPIPDGMSDDEVDLYDYHPLQETKFEYAERMREVIYKQQVKINEESAKLDSNDKDQ